MSKQITIRDVAKLAQVSIATASRVLNNTDYPVSEQTRQKVKNAAEDLKYTPSAFAQSFRQDVCQDIGLIIPNLSNPFYLQTMLGIDDVLSNKNYSMILCNTMRNPEREQFCLDQLYEKNIKGVILSSMNESGESVRKYIKKGMKFVLLDQMLNETECPSIIFDFQAGARMAVEYLINQGHKKIAFATAPMTRWSRIETYKGYQSTLASFDISFHDSLIYEVGDVYDRPDSDLELHIGQKIGNAFMKDGCPASAILCINDMIAIGIIQTLVKNGIRVPEDVSVIGFDDIPFANVFMPALTTVHYPAMECGRLAALMLIDILSSSSSEMSLSMNLKPTLIIRETVAARK